MDQLFHHEAHCHCGLVYLLIGLPFLPCYDNALNLVYNNADTRSGSTLQYSMQQSKTQLDELREGSIFYFSHADAECFSRFSVPVYCRRRDADWALNVLAVQSVNCTLGPLPQRCIVLHVDMIMCSNFPHCANE